MIDDPKAGKIYGADVAGPVFKDVAKSVITRLNISRDQ
jgi:cell division protein FtsI/penicillin-binding protein 2